MVQQSTARRLLCFLFALLLTAGILPAYVSATEGTAPLAVSYDLWIGDVQVTSANASDVLNDGTVSYDAAQNVLTLDGANLEATQHTGHSISSTIFADESIGTLTIRVKNTNKIDSTAFGTITAGIFVSESIIFEGDGTLHVKALSRGSEGNAVYSHMGDVTINSGTYVFDGDGSTGSYGIIANSNSGTVFANGGNITVKAGASGNTAAAIGGKLNLDGYENHAVTASVNYSGSPEITYNPDDQNISRMYKFIKISPPEYDSNGFQTNGTGYQPAPLVDGVYQIGNAGQLYWFAKHINNTNSASNAVLVNDIVVNEAVLAEDGTLNGDGSNFHTWTPIGQAPNEFTGTFKGQGHTISGLYLNDASGGANSFGLFGTIGSGGSVSDLGVIDSFFGTISADASSGSICGTNQGSVSNCYTTSAVFGASGGSFGALCGTNNGVFTNSYYLFGTAQKGIGSGAEDDTVAVKTEDEFASGEVTWLLNGEKSEGVWKQTIGSNPLPGFAGGTVYRGYADCTSVEMTYSNAPMSQTIPDHIYGEPVWNWAEGYKTALAVFSCVNDASHPEIEVNATVTSKVKTSATCTSKGVTQYTAEVVFDGKTYQDVKEIADIPMIAHDYQEGVCTVCGESLTISVPTLDPSKPAGSIQIAADEENTSKLVTEVGKIIDAVMENKQTDSVTQEVADKIYQAVSNRNDISILVQFDDSITASKAEQEAANASLSDQETLSSFFDLSILLQVNGETIGKITTLSSPMRFSLAVPSDLIKEGRTFTIIRIHNGIADKLETTLTAANALSFETDRFSTYALAYTNETASNTPSDGHQSSGSSENSGGAGGNTAIGSATSGGSTSSSQVPQTGDYSHTTLWALLLCSSVFGLFAMSKSQKKTKNFR